MALGQVRTNGNPAAGSFYGYQPAYYLVTGTGVGTADSGGAGSAIVEGTWTKALRAAQTVGTIVTVGPRADNGFVIVLDAATASDNGEASVAARLKTVIDAATGATSTVAAKTLALAEWA